jgi:hypothetical protein
MKIILVDEEAHHYIDMKDDLVYWQNKAQELEDELDLLREQQYREDTGMEPISHDYPADTTREEHTSARWSDYDKESLTQRIFMTGTYYGDARTIESIHAFFPYRTRASVTAMIYTLGGTVKKGIVHPRIQPKQRS